jgi:hypothetical protein
MTIGRRLAAVLLQVALLALPLSAARADCREDHAAMTDMAEMPGMTMPDGADAGHHECPAGTAACDSMLVCGPTLMVVEATLNASPVQAGTIAAPQFPRDPLSATRAPEPPPPRA